MNLTASTAEILVVIESLPQGEQRLGTGLGAGVEQNADLGVQDAAEGIEQPTVGVDLLGVLLFQTEDHLDRGQGLGAVIHGADELLVGGHG